MSHKQSLEFKQKLREMHSAESRMMHAGWGRLRALWNDAADEQLEQIAGSFDRALEEHTARTANRIHWLKGKYESKLEANRVSAQAELRDAVSLDRVLLREATRDLERQGDERLELVASAKQAELDKWREEWGELERRFAVSQMQLSRQREQIDSLKEELFMYEVRCGAVRCRRRGGARRGAARRGVVRCGATVPWFHGSIR